MLKSKAIELLGGSTADAAKAIGISYQAVDKWPDDLPPRIADRVMAALARKAWPELAEGELPSEPNRSTANGKPKPKRKTFTVKPRRDGPNCTDTGKPSHRRGK